MHPVDRLQIARYSDADDAEALELDRLCAQGGAFRLSFRRSRFRRRAENFDVWRLFTGRLEGRLVGLAGVALKPATVLGDAATVAFGFDLRVHPDMRGRGIGEAMTRIASTWGAEHSDFAYSWVASGNTAPRSVLHGLGGRPCARYRYLVYPTYRPLAPRRAARSTDPAEVHQTHVRLAGPFDLYFQPPATDRPERVGSWIVRDGSDVAACSAWDNSEILSEVIERVPPALRVAGAVCRAWPLARPRLPHIPRPGERLRSWYLYDASASCPDLGRDLLRGVAEEARERGIDYLYLVLVASQEAWAACARSDVPRALAPMLEYRMWGSRRYGGCELETAYVDVRDL